MSENEEAKSYHVISKGIHWVTALIFFGLLFVGFYMTGLPFGEDKLAIYALHKSFGLLLLFLVGVRVLMHLFVTRPSPLKTHKIWEKMLSKAAHVFLYFAMFALPLSGWVMSSAGDFSIAFFGVEMPDLVDKDKVLFDDARAAHEVIALIVILVLGLHIIGALKHHFIDGDETLKRMTSMRLGMLGGVFLALFVAMIFAPSVFMVSKGILKDVTGDRAHMRIDEKASDTDIEVSASDDVDIETIARDAQKWIIVPERSSIQFSVLQYGQPFTGGFEAFDGDIYFDPDDLGGSYARIVIDIASVVTGSDDRDEQARSDEWFDIEHYPEAIFESDSFAHIQGDEYKVSGHLNLRGVRLPLSFTFTVAFNADEEIGVETAQMQAGFALQRLDFGVGRGQWQKDDVIGNNVEISVDVFAQADGQ